MSNNSKSTVEAIFPLSYMQQGLLLHHLSSKIDQGFLNTECTLTGDFDIETFKSSCDLITKRHDILRSTVHWKKLEKPLHVIHKSKTIDIVYLNWSNVSETEKANNWNTLKENSLKAGALLETGALLQIKVVKFSETRHKILWPMHHILLDGWSGSNIIKDLFSIYDDLSKDVSPQLETLPNYKTYLNWIKNLPEDDPKTFWKNYLKDFKNANLFRQTTTEYSEGVTNTNSFTFSEIETNTIKGYCKRNKITINTLIQCVWSLVLSKYFNSKDVIHGTTVSGRAGDFPNINLLTGMFMNVQPVRGQIDNTKDFSNWFQDMQKYQFEARKYEYLSLDKLYKFINWSESSELFDSLVVFENYPAASAKKNALQVSDVKSGLTSTYPITLAVLPGIEIKFVLKTLSNLIDLETANWILETLKTTVSLISTEDVKNFNILNEKISAFKRLTPDKTNTKKTTNQSIEKSKTVNTVVNPRNKTELELRKIWESLLNQNNISITDNFFELGGKSLLAIKLFSKINSQFKTKLSATTLLEHATIAELSQLILDGKDAKTWDYIVPIRSKGTKNPLFCIHGGGGYVIFFNPLVNALNKNVPVYALEPAGLNSNDTMHKSIEAMAKDYAKEIKDAQPKGPYNLLTYCFSPAVGIEIANIFKLEGEKTNLIVIDSIIKQEDFASPERVKMRIYGFLNRVLKNPFSALKLMISNNYARFIRPKMIALFADEGKKNLEKITQNLIKIYVNYGWNKNHTDDVFLILTKKADKKLNPIYIESWEGITDGHVKVTYTSGDHLELFDSPHVESVAKLIEKDIYNL